MSNCFELLKKLAKLEKENAIMKKLLEDNGIKIIDTTYLGEDNSAEKLEKENANEDYC